MDTDSDKAQNLQELFGSFRAEWLEHRLYSLFSEPEYFPTLRDKRPCALVGGRGSGKTTVLRCMSYEGQFALSGESIEAFNKSDFIGLYFRVNTPHVAAFSGPDLSDLDWRRLFSHYINLIICEQIAAFACWYSHKADEENLLSASACRRISATLGVAEVVSVTELLGSIRSAIHEIELYINNIDVKRPTLSMLQRPIEQFIAGLRSTVHFASKTIYIIVDEYENLLDYQQIIVNTLIKHSGSGYVFKLGVRELGWRTKSTLNENEQLISPADYELISIEERLGPNFKEFSRRVCEARLSDWYTKYGMQHLALKDLLPNLTYEDEAIRLGVVEQVKDIKAQMKRLTLQQPLEEIHPLVLFVFQALNPGNLGAAIAEIAEFAAGKVDKKERYNNYKYAMLFKISGTKSDISKYYCGNAVFATISSSNIRFYLQLVAESMSLQLRSGKAVSEPISPEDQTKAARAIGLRYLNELEGMTARGAQIVKLLLGFGRLFQILSMNPIGGKPECTQFQLTPTGREGSNYEAAKSVLNQAVMHLGFVRHPGTKLSTVADTREWDYSLHPIFAPYFNFSHRRKRKMDVRDIDVLAMIDKPKDTIRALLKDRSDLAEQDAPVQLRLFEEYLSG